MYNAIFISDQGTYDLVKKQSVVLEYHDPFKAVIIDNASKLSVDKAYVKNTFTFSSLLDIPNNRAIIVWDRDVKSKYTALTDYLKANKITILYDAYNMGIITVELPKGTYSSFQAKLTAAVDTESVEQDVITQLDPCYAFTYDQHWHLGNQGAQAAWDAMAPLASNAFSPCQGEFPVFAPPSGSRDISLVSCCSLPEIAILDVSVEAGHPDLRNRFGTCGCEETDQPTFRATGTCNNNWNCVDNNTYVEPTSTNPVDAHGTAVTGVAIANNLNNNYVLSISQNYIKGQFLKIGYPGSIPNTISTSVSAIVMAIDKAILNPNCVAISMSWGGLGNAIGASLAVSEAFYYARNLARDCKGIIIFAAAGNSNSTTIPAPANNASVLAIGASTLANTKAGFSNYGSGLFAAAPGVSIRTTDRWGTNGYSVATSTSSSDVDAYNTNLGTALVTGTSFSCPMVAAIAGCMAAVMPTITADLIESILSNNATPVSGLGAGVVNFENSIQDVITISQSEDLTIVPTITASPATIQLCATAPLVFTVNVAVSGANATLVDAVQIEYFASADAFFTSADTLLYSQTFPVNLTENYTTSFTVPTNIPALLNTTKLFVRVTPYNSCGLNLSYGSTELIDDAAMTITSGGCPGTDLAVQILSWSYTNTGIRIFQVKYTNTGTTVITSANVTRGWVGGSTTVQNLSWTGSTGSSAPIQPGQSRVSYISFNTPSPAIPANYFHQINTVNGAPDTNSSNNFATILVNS